MKAYTICLALDFTTAKNIADLLTVFLGILIIDI